MVNKVVHLEESAGLRVVKEARERDGGGVSGEF